jgi:hypothetical protein
VCFILVMGKSISQPAKFALLVLALLAHEGSLFVGLLLACRYLDRRRGISYLVVLGIYAAAWLASYGGNPGSLLAAHTVQGRSAVGWIVRHPMRELLGLLVAFKALWVLPVMAAAIEFRRRAWKSAGFIVCCLGAGVLMTLLGVDTSRLAGFAFPAILVSLPILCRRYGPDKAPAFLSMVFLVNLLIPSVYVGVNTGAVVRSGLYAYLFLALVWVRDLMMFVCGHVAVGRGSALCLPSREMLFHAG